ncbi:MAG: hypothetical protein EZS28_021493, partial [Streblomastix strix]
IVIGSQGVTGIPVPLSIVDLIVSPVAESDFFPKITNLQTGTCDAIIA